MGLLDRLRSLAGGTPSHARDPGLYFHVRCDACGEVIRGRVSPQSELSQVDEGGGYFVRKVLVGQRCFRSIEVELQYADLGGKLLSREVHGGQFVDSSGEPA